jgi:hypothetical protein
MRWAQIHVLASPPGFSPTSGPGEEGLNSAFTSRHSTERQNPSHSATLATLQCGQLLAQEWSKQNAGGATCLTSGEMCENSTDRLTAKFCHPIGVCLGMGYATFRVAPLWMAVHSLQGPQMAVGVGPSMPLPSHRR